MFTDLPELVKPWNIMLPESAVRQFMLYREIMLEENKHTNLTRITEPAEMKIKHFVDSLAILAKTNCPTGPVLDLGSGAGLPGVPLKIACPQMQLTLIDSLQKRIEFLKKTASALNFTDVFFYHGRAEDLARQPDLREKYPLVVSRAVARLNILAELCLPFTAIGGIFAAYKGPEGPQELTEAKNALCELGVQDSEIYSYTLPLNMGRRNLILLYKIKATPQKYPRRAGIPAKKPLV